MEGLNSRGVRSRQTPPRKVQFPVEQEEVDVQSRRGLGRFHFQDSDHRGCHGKSSWEGCRGLCPRRTGGLFLRSNSKVA